MDGVENEVESVKPGETQEKVENQVAKKFWKMTLTNK